MDNQPHSWAGLGAKHKPRYKEMKQMTANMMAIVGASTPVNAPEIGATKVRVKTRRVGGHRKAYNREEDKLRPLIIKALKKRGFKVWRIENSLRGNKGVPDLFIAYWTASVVGWVECKTPRGVLSPEQKEFEDLCLKGKVVYYVIRSVEDVKNI